MFSMCQCAFCQNFVAGKFKTNFFPSGPWVHHGFEDERPSSLCTNLRGSQKVFGPKFVTTQSGRNRRSADFSTVQEIADITNQVFEAIQKYAE